MCPNTSFRMFNFTLTPIIRTNKDERLIYSKDNGKTVFEKRLPRGTIEKVLRSLPKPEDI